jgi:thiol-disulfide isomerase/thioredoxin
MKVGTHLLFLVLLFQVDVGFSQLKQGDKAPVINFEKSFPYGYVMPNGKPVMLDFWATWCAPCISALRETNAMIDKYRDKIEFLSITDSTSKNVEQFIRNNKFRHQFLVNKNQSTSRSYRVRGLPTAFLIDASGIIQWSGHGMSVNSKLLDEFLTTGKVIHQDMTKGISFSSITESKGDFTFELTEIVPGDENVPPGVMMGARGDSISYAIQNIPLHGIIELLYKNQTRQIIYHLKDLQCLKRNHTLHVSARHVDQKTIDLEILEMIGNRKNFKVSVEHMDTLAWVFKTVDESKRRSHKTKPEVTMGDDDAFNFHMGKDNTGQVTLSAVNLKLTDFLSAVSAHFSLLITFADHDDSGYDFGNIGLGNFDDFKNTMSDQYGLELVKETANVPFLLIEDQ